MPLNINGLEPNNSAICQRKKSSEPKPPSQFSRVNQLSQHLEWLFSILDFISMEPGPRHWKIYLCVCYNDNRLGSADGDKQTDGLKAVCSCRFLGSVTAPHLFPPQRERERTRVVGLHLWLKTSVMPPVPCLVCHVDSPRRKIARLFRFFSYNAAGSVDGAMPSLVLENLKLDSRASVCEKPWRRVGFLCEGGCGSKLAY